MFLWTTYKNDFKGITSLSSNYIFFDKFYVKVSFFVKVSLYDYSMVIASIIY